MQTVFFVPVQRAVIIIINVVDAFSIPISIKVYNMFQLEFKPAIISVSDA